MKSEAFLKEIRETDGLSRAVLKKIVVEDGTVVFHLLTDKTYSREDIAFASEVARRYVPAGYRAAAAVQKSVPSEEGIRREITELLKNRFPSAAAFVSPQDISVDVFEGGGRFVIGVGKSERNRFDRGGVIDELVRDLNRSHCGSWLGDFCGIEKETGEIEGGALPPAEYVQAPRTFAIENYEAIDGAEPKRATYIADLAEGAGLTVCGEIVYIEERVTKKEKPYFSVTLSDASGQLRISYFTRKATLEKVRKLKRGDSVSVTGDYEAYNGNLSFRARAIDFGTPPEGFVFEERPSRPAPANYTVVFPEPASDYVQSNLFGETSLPESFRKNTFVVFDLETTGLNTSPAGGAIDRIIELGAVKIANGEISEKFSTFVACPVKLSREIVSLTGIRDEMLVGAPDVSAVMADFYKFCEGAILVGHNVQFDLSFVRYYGEREGYRFQQPSFDTVAFAQEMLVLKNYKLNTVGEYFRFDFNHHRAYDDAFVTAKIFMALVRLKGDLPRGKKVS